MLYEFFFLKDDLSFLIDFSERLFLLAQDSWSEFFMAMLLFSIFGSIAYGNWREKNRERTPEEKRDEEERRRRDEEEDRKEDEEYEKRVNEALQRDLDRLGLEPRQHPDLTPVQIEIPQQGPLSQQPSK